MEGALTSRCVRRALRIRGTVQGVGFRPAMYRLALRSGVTGVVKNERGDVLVEVEGAPESVGQFVEEVRTAAPPAARVESIQIEEVAPRGEERFRIAPSRERASARDQRAGIPPDLAPCSACLRELEDPRDRRHRYPFINCTGCGPRFTIVRELPYDRGRTSMRAFTLCPACRREYEDPADRRFHAEPNACPACGPVLSWIRAGRRLARGEAALGAAARALAAGAVVAVKGVGGFLLAADATDEPAIARLRRRKRRPHKPLAVMGRDLEALEQIAVLDAGARRALADPARPIVLAPARGAALAPSVAPGLRDVGVFLPPTPLQHLLLAEGPPLQVMTSGNASEEPIARSDDEALRRLAPIADAFLLHDREVLSRADDSVVRACAGGGIPVRRARGRVPEAVPLPVAGPPILAVGGDLKNTLCLAGGGAAYPSQHIGDLQQAEAFAFFQEAAAHMKRLLGLEPEAVACDLHPDYRSTRWARASGLPRVSVQHHHAHVAACLCEHGRIGPVLGIAFDGTGYGEDGGLWGGEILVAGLESCRRLGHLRPIALPGGEAAIRAPWRLALAALVDAGEPLDLLPGVDRERARRVERFVRRGVATPASTGAGRWFDAVAALLGVGARVSYEGQAAAELEAIAAEGPEAPYELRFRERSGAPFSIDLRPVVSAICGDLRRGVPAAIVSARFHETVARIVLESCRRARARGAPDEVALTGGCFQNRRLAERARELLEEEGFVVLSHRVVPPGDGGLSLGQAAVASFLLSKES